MVKEILFRVGIGQKLIFCFLLIGIIPSMLIGYLGLRQASEGLEKLAFNQVEAVREIKKSQLDNYFEDQENDLSVLMDTAGTLRDQAFEKLKAVREAKKRTLKNYLLTIERQVQAFSENRMNQEAIYNFIDRIGTFRVSNNINDARLDELKSKVVGFYQNKFSPTYSSKVGVNPQSLEKLVNSLDADAIALQYYYIADNPSPVGDKKNLDRANDQSSFSHIHSYIHPTIRSFQDRFGFSDIYLADVKSGRILYSVNKHIDFGTSLIDGPYANSSLGKVFKKVKDAASEGQVYFSDYEAYFPAYEVPAGFIASPVFLDDKMLGVVIFQIPINKINLTMAASAGLGESGEAYLVGNDHLMRSDSSTDYEHRSVRNSFHNPDKGQSNSFAITQALTGFEGTGVIQSYLGRPVLSAWSSVSVGDTNWALITEIDVTEALSPVDYEGQTFYEKYAQAYGYPDLYLINPDGYIFYSVAGGSEENTNILTGKYKSSSLGGLVREVSISQQFGFVDFAQYMPSNNEPSAFVAQPFVKNSEIELIIALRLPLEGINNIMAVRDGMGESGESYLVGPDYRMRSDSTKDPDFHSVSASFAGTVEENGMDTFPVHEALSGKKGIAILNSYSDNLMISAFSPIEVAGHNWALVAEVDQTEALSAVTVLQWRVVMVLTVAVVIIVFSGLIISRRISYPISKASRLATQVSEGDLTTDVNVVRGDEIGLLQKALRTMTEGLRSMVSQIDHSAVQQSEAAERLATITKETRQRVQEQHQNTDLVATAINEMGATVLEVSRNTADASIAAREAQNEVEKGGLEVKQTIEAIRIFAGEIESMTSTLQQVEVSADKIGGIVDVINNIAEQTNLLALNAAIEAARAGEYGRGFTVVADEVRLLASNTQDSTKQIASMISELQICSQGSTDVMGRCHEQMSTIVALAENTGEVLRAIHKAVVRINDMNAQIAFATEEQSCVAEDINQNIVYISQLSEKTDFDAQQISKASDELAQLASIFKEELRRFRT